MKHFSKFFFLLKASGAMHKFAKTFIYSNIASWVLRQNKMSDFLIIIVKTQYPQKIQKQKLNNNLIPK